MLEAPMLVVQVLAACALVSPSTSVPTSSTPATGIATTADTGPPPPPDCEVEARDGELRDCLSEVVYCDVSSENLPVLEACADCFGDVVAYLTAAQATFGTDDWETCAEVSLPPLPETCSDHTLGTPSPDATPFVMDSPVRVWTDGAVDCFWSAVMPYGGAPSLPLVVRTEEELAQQLFCHERDGLTVVPPPAEVAVAFGLPERQVLVYDAEQHTWLGVYGTELVLDAGCFTVSGVPPQVDVAAVIVDEPVGATLVSCRLGACPAEIRGEPLPP